MAKFEVTLELASIIKSSRAQNNITAKSVAEHIGKSQSYISRLEKAEIKTIEEQELTEIFKFIYHNDDKQSSLDSILEKIYGTISIQFTNEEIDQQRWWLNYDSVVRYIPIPAELIDDMLSRMEHMGLTTNELCRRINANEALPPQITNNNQYRFNEWQTIIKNHKIEKTFIKIKMTEETLSDILNKKITSTNYISLLSISYYLAKIEKYGSQVSITDEENRELNDVACNYLSEFKFLTIAGKNNLQRLAKTEEERENLISSFDRENFELVNNIITAYKVYSELDIQTSNKVLKKLVKNLKWDLGFMMALTSIEYCQLQDTSFSNKTNLLREIKDLIKKYQDLPKEQRSLNNYNLT